jgi:predicted AAA+ superfamily ATPase|tara:strand:- start:40 stop:213 length:174 start_codon:yes stop_codon:yes gene_type:complete
MYKLTPKKGVRILDEITSNDKIIAPVKKINDKNNNRFLLFIGANLTYLKKKYKEVQR